MTTDDDAVKRKIMILATSLWPFRLKWRPHIEEWLNNFQGANAEAERAIALRLLSQFVCLDQTEIEQSLKAVYRLLFRYPTLQSIRRANGNSMDPGVIEPAYESSLQRTRFLGLGAPGSSGNLLLYHFRQQNELPDDLFCSTESAKASVAAGAVDTLVYIDDVSGSGKQATDFWRDHLTDAVLADKKIYYFPLFGTAKALNKIRDKTGFTARSLFTLDGSFRCFSTRSRYFADGEESTRRLAKEICLRYGKKIEPSAPLGFRDGQLLLGFSHNTPNNTLPIFWSTGKGSHSWRPLFVRKKKPRR